MRPLSERSTHDHGDIGIGNVEAFVQDPCRDQRVDAALALPRERIRGAGRKLTSDERRRTLTPWITAS